MPLWYPTGWLMERASATFEIASTSLHGERGEVIRGIRQFKKKIGLLYQEGDIEIDVLIELFYYTLFRLYFERRLVI